MQKRRAISRRAGGKNGAVMRIGILGSGLMGGEAGDDLRPGRTRGGLQLRAPRGQVEAAGAGCGWNRARRNAERGGEDADAVLLAVHWSRVDDVLAEAGDLRGKVIVS